MLQRIKSLLRPDPTVRSTQEQLQVDAQIAGWSLYHYDTCGFCRRVRRVMRRLDLDIELRDIRRDPGHYQDLLAGGGRTTVPCLHLPDQGSSESRWMYESADIVTFLERRFSAGADRTD